MTNIIFALLFVYEVAIIVIDAWVPGFYSRTLPIAYLSLAMAPFIVVFSFLAGAITGQEAMHAQLKKFQDQWAALVLIVLRVIYPTLIVVHVHENPVPGRIIALLHEKPKKRSRGDKKNQRGRSQRRRDKRRTPRRLARAT